jgi:hypothetical protein
MVENMNKKEQAIYFTVLVLLFHITRNISTPMYIGVLFLSYAWLYHTYIYGNMTIKYNLNIKFRPVALLFILSLIWLPFISLLNMNMSDYLASLPRYLVTLPFIFFCFLYQQYRYELAKHILRLFCIVMTIAGLSIPFQIMFGRIYFLAETQMREGYERYASLAGSLTALGSLGGISLAILLFTNNELFSKKQKIMLVVTTVLCMLMTLQKAAVVNIIICLVFYTFLYGSSSFIKKSFSLLGMGLFTIAIFYSLLDTEFGKYIDSIVNYTFADTSVGVKGDFIIRMWDLPSRLVYYHDLNWLDFIFGIGFPALAGTLGNSQFPMAHNNYFDLIFSGGIIHLVSFLILLIQIPFKVMKKKVKGIRINNIDRSYSIVIILILINMMIGAPSFYQPIYAVIIFFIIFSYDKVTNSYPKGV